MAPAETRAIVVKVLSVGWHPDDHVALRKMLATSYSSARTASANWEKWTLLARLEQLPDPPLLIVVSRTADEFLWAEALNLGAFAVLPEPYRASEVVGTLVLAGLRLNSIERPRREEVA